MDSHDRTNLTLWRWQRTTAVILLPLVLFHVIYMYFFVGMDSISAGSVSDRLAVIGFLVVDVVLLLVVVVHAFTGIRSILVDYQGDRRRIDRITAVIGVCAVGTVVYGLVALAAFL